MWEGEVVDCVAVSSTCKVDGLSGAYITSLASGAWGASGSVYNIALSPVAAGVSTSASQALQNAVFYKGSGLAAYVGTLNDIAVENGGLAGTAGGRSGTHPAQGFTGGRRVGARWAAMIYGAEGGMASDPTLDRVKADGGTNGCDAASGAAPCFNDGKSGGGTVDGGPYKASFATATWTGNTVTISGGLAAHARPFVVGQAFFCSGCNSGLVITALSVPPTQDTARMIPGGTTVAAGENGQTFTMTVKNAAGQAIGGSGSGAVTAGCSGTSGTGSNCILIPIAINNSARFGTTAALATCGANNINGNSPNYVQPYGKCQDNGIGELTRSFRIGTQQLTFGNGAISMASGSTYDDGVDPVGGVFTRNSAFTCNIVAAKVVECVKGAAYSAGVLTGVGQWASGSTYVSYGDGALVSGRIASLLGYVGGQSFPFIAGSGYTPGQQLGIAGVCPTMAGAGTLPRMDITIGSGGSIIDAVPSAASSGNSPAGIGIGSACTFTPTGGTGGSITAPIITLEGLGGIATYNTNSNTMGLNLYDNSGLVGNPLNSFFTNGFSAYSEPGLPVRPFGTFQGAAVSG